MRSILAAAALMCGAMPALACDLSRDECWPSGRVQPQVRGWVRTAPPAPRVIIKREVVVQRVERPDTFGHDAGAGACKPALDALGEVMHTTDNGKASARKAWMDLVRWRHGERYMEADLARDMHYQCNRVTTPTTEGVIGAAVSKATHGLKCEVRAIPCAAPIIREDK